MTRTGAAWRDLPAEFGKWGTVWDLFDTWNKDGTLDQILHRLRATNIDLDQGENRLWCVDGTIGGFIKMAFINRYLNLTN